MSRRPVDSGALVPTPRDGLNNSMSIQGQFARPLRDGDGDDVEVACGDGCKDAAGETGVVGQFQAEFGLETG